VVYPVLEFREEKHILVKVKRGNVNFFLYFSTFFSTRLGLERPKKTRLEVAHGMLLGTNFRLELKWST
jgi:hypothetical protein